MYNRSTIMTRAHAIRKSFRWTMSQALRSAWTEAKYQIEAAARKHDEIFLHQMNDNWGNAGMEEYYRLSAVS